MNIWEIGTKECSSYTQSKQQQQQQNAQKPFYPTFYLFIEINIEFYEESQSTTENQIKTGEMLFKTLYLCVYVTSLFSSHVHPRVFEMRTISETSYASYSLNHSKVDIISEYCMRFHPTRGIPFISRDCKANVLFINCWNIRNRRKYRRSMAHPFRFQ